MSAPIEPSHDLLPHPESPAPGGCRIVAGLRLAAPDRLEISWSLTGPLGQLRIPAWLGPHPGTELWKHACFEAFVGPAAASSYHELNLSPSGAWGVHAFRDRRDGGPIVTATSPVEFRVERDGDRLVVWATVDLAALSPDTAVAALRVGLAAVLEDSAGGLSYWALRHPAGRPDFHHPDGFALRIDPEAG